MKFIGICGSVIVSASLRPHAPQRLDILLDFFPQLRFQLGDIEQPSKVGANSVGAGQRRR
jgi:hypothetical protein